MDAPQDLVRPMLNTPVGHQTEIADELLIRGIARVNASQAANQVVMECVYADPLPLCREDWLRLLRIWESLRVRAYALAHN